MEKISVLLAVYKPNRTFFRKQLDSINKQTYKNIELIVMDDSDDREEFNQISSIINEHITNIDYKVYANECNVGSNRTFEKLTQIADGDYFAYCDQDDIWEEYKIETLVNEIKKENAVVCYSDLSVIDEDDQQISECAYHDALSGFHQLILRSAFPLHISHNRTPPSESIVQPTQ